MGPAITITIFPRFFLKTEQNYFKKKKLYHLGSIFLFLLIFINKTFFQDPGVIPKTKNYPKKLNQVYIQLNPKYKHLIINGGSFQFKFCETCCIWRPLRTSHCSSCDNCFLKFDHHCPWIGTCVGLRNYRSFLLFIFSLVWYLFFSFIQIFYLAFFQKISKKKIINCPNDMKIYLKNFSIIVLLIVNLAILVFSSALLLLHFYLIFNGKTTSEIFKSGEKNFWLYNFKKEIITRISEDKKPSLIVKSTKKKKKCDLN